MTKNEVTNDQKCYLWPVTKDLKGGRFCVCFSKVERPLEFFSGEIFWWFKFLPFGVAPSSMKQIRRICILPEIKRFRISVKMKANSVT